MAGEDAFLNNQGWLYHPDYPDHWERCPLYSMAQWINGLAFRDIDFTSTGMPVIKIAEIKGGISGQTKFTQKTFDASVRVSPGDLLFSWSGQPETSIDVFWWHGPDGWLNQHIFRIMPADGIDSTFFYYFLRYLKPNFVGIARNKQTTGLGHVTKRDLQNIDGAYPHLSEQRAIAHILGTLDDKIENLRRQNETLEAMARALFKAWFVDFEPVRAKIEGRWRRGETLPGLPAHLYDLFPDRLVESELGEIPEGWEMRSLDAIANYINGLALQKFPPESEDEFLPVIKIAQLRAGNTIGADKASTRIKPEYIVDDGDVLFSWSGSLEVEVWNGGRGALNQHLFKVTSDVVPKWFYFFATRHHLQNFRAIAADKATTMGHIQRKHLTSAKIAVPPPEGMKKFDIMISPLFDQLVGNAQQSHTLAALRDTLLPKLISGELRVKDAEAFLERAGA